MCRKRSSQRKNIAAFHFSIFAVVLKESGIKGYKLPEDFANTPGVWMQKILLLSSNQCKTETRLCSKFSFCVCTLIHGIPCICGGRSKIVTGRFLLTKMSQRMCLENLSPYLWVF